MRYTATFACIALAVFGALAAPPAEAQWRALGLSGLQVKRLYVHEGYLYACTNDGLHRLSLASTDTIWNSVGFVGETVNDVIGIHPSVLLAAKALTAPGDTVVSLFRSNDGGASWIPFQRNFGSGGGTSERQARRLLSVAYNSVILATSSRIESSTNYGLTWVVTGQPGGVINAIEASPAGPTLVWAGGETNIFSPYVLKSSDAGNTWTQFNPFADGDNAVDAIASHPADPNAVYLGMEGRVMKSEDGGTTWWTMTSPNPTNYTFGMAARLYPLKLYAAGASFEIPPGVTLYTSLTGGLSWQSFTYPSYAGNGVYHLLLYPDIGDRTVFLATGNGVYSFTETPTGVAVSTLRVRPNPFRGSTEIEFALASPEEVTLRVVDVCGRVVASLIGSALGTGPHRAAWNAGDLPAGIYFARLRTGGREESVKLVHFR